MCVWEGQLSPKALNMGESPASAWVKPPLVISFLKNTCRAMKEKTKREREREPTEDATHTPPTHQHHERMRPCGGAVVT